MNKLFWNITFCTRVLKAKLLKTYAPFQVQFSVTDRCNLQCSYCYANYPARGYRELDMKNILRIIDQLAELGTMRINLVGGEPLLRDDIGEIIDYIKDKKIECAMTSNGYLVPKKMRDVKKLDLLCVSLDGDKKANDANRGNGSYDAAMKAIVLAKEKHIPVQVAAVITKNNLHSIGYILEEGKKYGFMVGFATLINVLDGNIKRACKDIPTDNEYKEALAEILRLKKEGYPVLFSRKSLEYSMQWPYSYSKDKVKDEAPQFKHIRCNAGKYFAIIDTNGDLYPCPSLIGVINPINAVELGVRKAFSDIENHGCKTCHIPCQNEFNLIYSLDPEVLCNAFLNYRHMSE